MMTKSRLQSAGRWIVFFARDILVAAGAAATGGPIGGLIFLVVVGLVDGELPQLNDIRLLPWAAPLALIEGAICGLVLRIAAGKIQRLQLWAIGFMVFGGIAGPLALIRLVLDAIGSLPPILIGGHSSWAIVAAIA